MAAEGNPSSIFRPDNPIFLVRPFSRGSEQLVESVFSDGVHEIEMHHKSRTGIGKQGQPLLDVLTFIPHDVSQSGRNELQIESSQNPFEIQIFDFWSPIPGENPRIGLSSTNSGGEFHYQALYELLPNGALQLATELRCDIPLSIPLERVTRLTDTVNHIKSNNTGRYEIADLRPIARSFMTFGMPKVFEGTLY